MSIEIKDLTGEPETRNVVDDAIAVVTKHLRPTLMFKLPPDLAVQLPAIRRCLLELRRTK